jgi:hypothetical protein
MRYLEFNKTKDLKLIGGNLDEEIIEDLFLGEHTEHLRLH